MKLYLLDTDILGLLKESDSKVAERVAQCEPNELAVTVVAVEEQIRGWFTLLRRAKSSQQLAFAYDQLAATLFDLSSKRIVSFSEWAIAEFERLKKSKLGVRGNDLRIASIALEHGATVVTRNIRDFRLVPGLNIEDWSK